MALINKEKKYKWHFVNIGGSARVRINSGDDIAHLAELDPKMWTVLSCPTTGLEIDDKSLKYNDLILKGADTIDINYINTEDANGKKLYSSAKQILENLGKEGSQISLADTADITAIFAKTRFNGDGIITEASSDHADLKTTIATAISTVGNVTDRSGAPGINADLIET